MPIVIYIGEMLLITPSSRASILNSASFPQPTQEMNSYNDNKFIENRPKISKQEQQEHQQEAQKLLSLQSLSSPTIPITWQAKHNHPHTLDGYTILPLSPDCLKQTLAANS